MEYEQLKEHHDAVKSENESLKKILEHDRAEKQALDQMFIEQVQKMLQIKKDIILMHSQIKDLILKCEQKEDQIKRLEEKNTEN